MKYEQIDQALLFIDQGKNIILQHEFLKDRRLIVDYLRAKLEPYIIQYSSNIFRYRDTRIILLQATRDDDTHGYDDPYMFFIERKSDSYVEGDIIGITMDDKELPIRDMQVRTTAMIKPHVSQELLHNGTFYNAITVVQQPGEDIDDQTLILQFKEEHLRSIIRGIVSGYKHKSAESFIDKWRTIDIFVNLSRAISGSYDKSSMRGKPWLRIVYECLDGNPSPGCRDRFPGATIIRVDRTLNKPTMTLDMLLEGR